tara:strand:+ start:552 stop:830 length:279 start_codon:yes stop_codon:yes gene_type:complete
MSDFKANEKSSLSISLPMLIQAVVGIGALVAMWTSTQADLSALQKDVGQVQDHVDNLLELQDKPIPSDVRQDNTLKYFEKELDRLRDIVDKK